MKVIKKKDRWILETETKSDREFLKEAFNIPTSFIDVVIPREVR